MALVLHTERALVLRRRPDDRSFAHRWCLPGGRIELDEAPEEGAVRETREETGLVISLEAALGPRRVALPHRGIVFEIHRFVAIAEHDRVVISEEHVDARWIGRDEAAEAERLLPCGLAGEVTTELLERFGRREL